MKNSLILTFCWMASFWACISWSLNTQSKVRIAFISSQLYRFKSMAQPETMGTKVHMEHKIAVPSWSLIIAICYRLYNAYIRNISIKSQCTFHRGLKELGNTKVTWLKWIPNMYHAAAHPITTICIAINWNSTLRLSWVEMSSIHNTIV